MQHDRSMVRQIRKDGIALYNPWSEAEDAQLIAVALQMPQTPWVQIARAAVAGMPQRTSSAIRHRLAAHLRDKIAGLWLASAPPPSERHAPREPRMRVIIPNHGTTSMSGSDIAISLPQAPWLPQEVRASGRPEAEPHPCTSLVRRRPRPDHPTIEILHQMLTEHRKSQDLMNRALMGSDRATPNIQPAGD